MKICFALQRIENHFIDWILRKNRCAQWLLMYFGIPAVLISLISLCVSPMYLIFLMMGMV